MSKVETYTIERGVPLPPPRVAANYPFHMMEAGDSFVLNRPDQKDKVRVHNAGRRYCAKHRPELRCVIRREGAKLRVWLAPREGNGKK